MVHSIILEADASVEQVFLLLETEVIAQIQYVNHTTIIDYLFFYFSCLEAISKK